MNDANRLSEKSVVILRLIADGRSYGQIVDANPDITYLDIFEAAREALLISESRSDYRVRLQALKVAYPRAYERWATEEDAELLAMHSQGTSISQMSARFQRQPSAIRSRLEKLGLICRG